MTRAAVVFLFVFLSLALTEPATAQSEPSLLISEFQTGSDKVGERPASCLESEYDAGKLEFVELYNPSDYALDLTGIKLEFVTESGLTVRHVATLQGQVQAKSLFLITYKCYLQDLADMFFNGSTQKDIFPKTSGGYLRLVDQSGSLIDQVSWAKATAISGWWHEPKAISHDYSINRVFSNNSFSTQITPTTPKAAFAQNNPQTEPEEEPEPEPSPETTEPETEANNLCDGIVLSEILPNPTGEDSGAEFIEIHNPTDKPIHLLGCALKLENSTKQFNLPDLQIAPDQYIAFYNSETKLSLTNSNSVTVWLVTQTSEQSVKYADNLGSDISWSFIDGAWKQTQTPTPNHPNKLLVLAEATEQHLAQCEPGKIRNPETNRCKSTQSQPVITPCAPGQERNSNTNRCRTIAAASTQPKPCPEGQERNTDTNRCRKILGASTNLPSVKDIPSVPSQNSTVFWVIGALFAAGVVYCIYEWRQTVARALNNLKTRLSK
ncbi:MAG TPA: lamin tail domain-containing protein [Candidatus Saccharimonadales bacterium]|nr:lamin tail domain-containing protein [Candidatus Saccharimonadales bacterium]